MKILLIGVLAAMTLFADAALAQRELGGKKYSIVLSNLRTYALVEDGKSAPRQQDAKDTGSVALDVMENGVLLGKVFTLACPDVLTSGRGRMHYDMEIRLDLESASCGPSHDEVDFQWQTYIEIERDRWQFKGEVSVQEPCPSGKRDCEPPASDAVERAVLRVNGDKCSVELYEFRETWMFWQPNLTDKDKFTLVTLWTPKSRCEILIF